ncbi:MAG: electron transport complex subunit RsxC [Alteromonadaceae bacterium]|nr:electron transport complex subunit RsxC [Alteromonadaceae bacterium]
MMGSVIDRITRGHFWHFHGGIHPPEQKFLTKNKPIRNLPLPGQLILPIQQHIGQPGDLLVSVGDHVLKGQVLTRSKSPATHSMVVPIHAPTSGIITAIKNSVIAHPSGLTSLCLFIEPDGEDKWQERNVCEHPQSLTREQVIDKITSAGIAGMGGAGFPTHIKVNTQAQINYLIINAAECEPYITADDLLIREHSATIIDGINILERLLTPHHILIGIEDNKPEAIKVLQQATADNPKIKVCVLPTKYPTGGEKQLIQILTGQEVPSGVIPSKLGIVMQNIATCFAIADAVIYDTPLIRRVVTVSGQALDKPQNVWALLGTPVNYLLEQCHYQNYAGQSNVNDKMHLIMGGPMMGFSLSTDQVPVVKITNCVLAPSKDEIPADNKEVECIRCGQCADVCPAQLLPQELQWSAKASDHQQLVKLNLADCIECGACAYVCPSQIPLVHYYRIAKAEIREQHLLNLQSEKAKTRFEARKIRLEKEKLARETKQKKAAEARKAKMAENTSESSNAISAVAAALARVKAKKAKLSSQQGEENSAEKAIPEKAIPEKVQLQADKKTKVAAAIARAKAKKLAAKASASQSSDAETKIQSVEKPTVPTETSGAKTEAKAEPKTEHKTETKTEKNKSETSETNDSTPKEPVHKANNDKKLKVAAAIAKAKAKKAQKLAEQNQNDNSDELPENKAETSLNEKAEAAQAKKIKDDNKAKRIAAAVAKAKAKKQEQQNQQNQQKAE